ncbi:creatininase family protein [Aeoliella mucimassa]|uniref:Creatinine amidohydrolase n=1 Tax=Aeoliella mucimassa TaxID=2527972 RepID=A0A518AIZ2_9BACT|nr:creatininase family protein [Aeoliella mucimassa]QDU54709.1 Creatinine amidohydrolase [Aeoliella mucimassa]
MPLRPYLLAETNLRRLQAEPPRVAVLPWGATEAHNYHMPYGTDVYEAQAIAGEAARRAAELGTPAIVLPVIPFGNDGQQLDQVATISITTATSLAILGDVAHSLVTQGIDRLLIVNGHGGNHFKPTIRDLEAKFPLLVVLANFFDLATDTHQQLFELPGDHADEMETSLMLHLHPELVEFDQAGPGTRVATPLDDLKQLGAWSPRPWSKCHPDTGSGDPSRATAEKGQRYFEAITESLAQIIARMASSDCDSLVPEV